MIHVIEYLVWGILLALITTELEYKWWPRHKNENLFHTVGFSSVALASGILLLFDFKVVNLLSVILGFWNVFELYGNYRHGAKLLYIGKTAKLDKFLRKLDNQFTRLKVYLYTKYHFRFNNIIGVKFLLHIVSLILFTILLITS